MVYAMKPIIAQPLPESIINNNQIIKTTSILPKTSPNKNILNSPKYVLRLALMVSSEKVKKDPLFLEGLMMVLRRISRVQKSVI